MHIMILVLKDHLNSGKRIAIWKKNLSKENGFLEGYFKGAVDMLAVENLFQKSKNANNFNHIKTNNNQFSSRGSVTNFGGAVSETSFYPIINCTLFPFICAYC